MYLREIFTRSKREKVRRAGAGVLAGCLLVGAAVGMTGCAEKNEKAAEQAQVKEEQKKKKRIPIRKKRRRFRCLSRPA